MKEGGPSLFGLVFGESEDRLRGPLKLGQGAASIICQASPFFLFGSGGLGWGELDLEHNAAIDPVG